MKKKQYYSDKESFTRALNHFTINIDQFKIDSYDYDEILDLWSIEYIEY